MHAPVTAIITIPGCLYVWNQINNIKSTKMATQARIPWVLAIGAKTKTHEVAKNGSVVGSITLAELYLLVCIHMPYSFAYRISPSPTCNK